MPRHKNQSSDEVLYSKKREELNKQIPKSTPEQDAKMVEQFLKDKGN